MITAVGYHQRNCILELHRPKPTASAYVTDRDGKNDGIHVVVVDDNGEVTGIKGNVLEKHLDLSKALDAVSGTGSSEDLLQKLHRRFLRVRFCWI